MLSAILYGMPVNAEKLIMSSAHFIHGGINSMKLVIMLYSMYWLIHTKDESKRGTAFAFIFGVNWLCHWGVTVSFGVFFHEIRCNGMMIFMEFMRSAFHGSGTADMHYTATMQPQLMTAPCHKLIEQLPLWLIYCRKVKEKSYLVKWCNKELWCKGMQQKVPTKCFMSAVT